MENLNETNIITVKEDDIQERANTYLVELKKKPEVLNLASTLDVRDKNAILEFGNEPAEEISKFADAILGNIKNNSVQGSSVMIRELTSIMKKFDKNDFEEEEKKGFFSKLFQKNKNSIEKLMGKYKSIGGEIDKIYTEISKYKKDLSDTNIMLDSMYEQNFEYYKQLEKYVAAGNLMAEKMENEDIPQLEREAQSGDQLSAMNLDNAKNSLEMLKQRVYDLEMAKMVSLQTAPQIRMIQKGNYKLVSKIHSAFIITIPVFKNGIVQAVALKRQKLVSDSLSELDRTTNELLLKNAQNIKSQSIDIAKMAGGTSVKMDTLEKTWSTIMEGLDETRQIEEENSKLREEGIEKIHDMNIKMRQKVLKGK